MTGRIQDPVRRRQVARMLHDRNQNQPRFQWTSRPAKWFSVHPEFTTRAQPPRLPPNSEMLLQAQNEYLCAGAVWKRAGGIWSCVQAAPILNWMLKMDPAQTRIELAKRNCSYAWIKPNPAPAKDSPS